MILDAHHTCIRMCGILKMDSPRDAYLLALCRASLPSRYAPTLVVPPPKLTPRTMSFSEGSEVDATPLAPSPRSSTFSEKRVSETSARKKASDGGEGAEGSGTPPQVMRSLGGGGGGGGGNLPQQTSAVQQVSTHVWSRPEC